jgi:hypothetical protein
VAGPVGKIAGGLVGKTVVKKLIGGGKKKKKDIPDVEVAQSAPASDAAGTPAADKATAIELRNEPRP